MARRTKYFSIGYEEGESASYDTDWQPGEMKKKYDDDDLGEVVSQILEHWQQMEGTIYYEGLSDTKLTHFEEGFYHGFVNGVTDQMRKRKSNPRRKK